MTRRERWASTVGQWLPDAVGLLAAAAVVSGIWELAGAAWGRIALGAPVLIAYVVREVAGRRKGRPA